MTNMRAMFLEQLSQSGLIIFNRTPEEMDRAIMRLLSIKANNPPAQIVFEREDGEMYDPADEPMPFDVTGPVIEIEDMDYGLWYLDAIDIRNVTKASKSVYCTSLPRSQPKARNLCAWTIYHDLLRG